jgi:hypothetical protein
VARFNENPQVRKRAYFWHRQSKDSRVLRFVREVTAGERVVSAVLNRDRTPQLALSDIPLQALLLPYIIKKAGGMAVLGEAVCALAQTLS